ncbi:hypothetical protein GCM10018785_63200 [Streptomyces longispororuber]|uniref:DUF3618 domain-containing protein n=1 Tax=Streptomyces longispororuber TaxID=68230 RepID=A0A919DUW2_9ACTN|nr:DUF3618 domain-containing protein [Streptomyces longispororuber]GHE86884.1 hypothetical protein GCM10018785_63200 [Streptomyces longispororuber]
MGPTPDELRQETEETRAHLSDSVDRLAERISPQRVVRRRASSARHRATAVRDRVMGTVHTTASRTGGTVEDATGRVREQAGQVREQAGQVPEQLRERTQGSPLAAGLIAFGAGLLTGALFPATSAEARVGRQVREHSPELLEPVKEAVRGAGQELREPAREAAQAVKDTARDAARSTPPRARGTE